MNTATPKDIVDYWNVQPPHKAQEEHEPYSFEWYQSISRHRYSVVPYMRDYVSFEQYTGRKVLEIGFGAGTDLCEFARNGADVTGVDITDAAMDLARRRLDVEGLTATIGKYDGLSLPFADAGFDLVYSWGVLHHTPYMEDLFVEAHRVLRPGGTLMLMLYHRLSAIFYYSILYRRRHLQGVEGSRHDLLSRYSEFREDCPYTRASTTREIEQTLWYYSNVDATVDYPVYDLENERKIPLVEPLEFEATGDNELDLFMERLNADLEAGADVRPYGWHLLVKATK
jgi:SAM-dependent methyltransferase